jgi:hypothetical protein
VRIRDYLSNPAGSPAAENAARAFGITPAEATTALAAISSELSRAIERNTLNRGGIADMVAAIGAADPAPALGSVDLATPEVTELGIGYLEQIFGNRDRSRAVAARISRETGLPDDLIRQMLPAAATIVMGALAEGSRSALRDVMSKVPGFEAVSVPSAGPLSLPGSEPPARPAFGSGDLPPQTPLPIPGNDVARPQGRSRSQTPSFPDVVRRGGSRVPSPGGPNTGGSLDTVIRDILGGLLGFENKGVVSWIVRYIVVRYGMSILRAILGRLLPGGR